MKSLSKLYPCFLFAALLFAACQKKVKEDVLPAQENPKEIAARHQALLQEIQKSGPQKAGFRLLSTSEYTAQLKKSPKSKIDEKTITFLDGYNIYQKGAIFFISKKAQKEAKAQSVLGFSSGYNLVSPACGCGGALASVDSQTFDDNCTRSGGGLVNIFTLLDKSTYLVYEGNYVEIIENQWLYMSGVLTITWEHDIYGLYFNYVIGSNVQYWITKVNS